jgi:hypothetical protein
MAGKRRKQSQPLTVGDTYQMWKNGQPVPFMLVLLASFVVWLALVAVIWGLNYLLFGGSVPFDWS